MDAPVAYGSAGRKIPVPPVLRLPAIAASSELTVLDARITATARRACASTRQTLCEAYSAARHVDDVGSVHPAMRDELSQYLNQAARAFDSDSSLSRCLVEFDVREAVRRRGAADRTLVGMLQQMHRWLGAGNGEFRRGPIAIKPDEMGNSVVFPDAGQCVPLVETLQSFLADNLPRYPGMSAVVALVAIVHAHPFGDGNGRAARTLFNALLAKGCGTDHFMPLSLLAHLSGGGFILKLRRAMYGAEWDQLGAYIAEALALSDRLQHPDGDPRP